METTHLTRLHAEKNSFAALVPAVQSALLLFCTLFPLGFLHLIFHEGGHALVDITSGGKIDLFYVHPFALNGYVRPTFDWGSVWMHVAGGISGLAIALLIFLLVWKYRSVSTLPLIMLLPWTALMQGPLIATVTGDWRNLVRLTGMPEVILIVTGVLILLVGALLFVSSFPLLGLAPENKRSFIVVPLAIILWSIIGTLIAYLFVPGSPVDVKYGLADEILTSAKMVPLSFAEIGVGLAVIYFTVYRFIYHRLPTRFKMELTRLSWKDLLVPGVLAAICVVIGLLIVA